MDIKTLESIIESLEYRISALEQKLEAKKRPRSLPIQKHKPRNVVEE
jgi:hypothetical protein